MWYSVHGLMRCTPAALIVVVGFSSPILVIAWYPQELSLVFA